MNPAGEALELCFEHRRRTEAVAMIHSHSHVDHHGGVKAVVTGENSGVAELYIGAGATGALSFLTRQLPPDQPANL